jgi:Na+/proline symporter
MHWINWVIVAAYLDFVVWDGLRRTRGTTNIEGYFLANRSCRGGRWGCRSWPRSSRPSR